MGLRAGEVEAGEVDCELDVLGEETAVDLAVPLAPLLPCTLVTFVVFDTDPVAPVFCTLDEDWPVLDLFVTLELTVALPALPFALGSNDAYGFLGMGYFAITPPYGPEILRTVSGPPRREFPLSIEPTPMSLAL